VRRSGPRGSGMQPDVRTVRKWSTLYFQDWLASLLRGEHFVQILDSKSNWQHQSIINFFEVKDREYCREFHTNKGIKKVAFGAVPSLLFPRPFQMQLKFHCLHIENSTDATSPFSGAPSVTKSSREKGT
jgi:hypothetical protein